MIIVYKSCLLKTVLDERRPLLPLLCSTVLALNDYSVEGVEVIVIWVEPELKMTSTSACPLSPLVLHTVMAGEEAVQQWHLYLIQCDKLSWPLSVSLTSAAKLQCKDFHIHACMSVLTSPPAPLSFCLFPHSAFPAIVFNWNYLKSYTHT